MAYDTSKLASLQALKDTATRIKKEYLAAISKSKHAIMQKAAAIPSADEAEENVMYLVKNEKTGHYDIYVLVDGAMEWLDDTTIDLDDVAGDIYTGTKTDKAASDSSIIDAFFAADDAPVIKKGDVFVVNTVINGKEYEKSSYYFSGTAWEAITGCVDADKVIAHENILLAGDFDRIGNWTKDKNGTKLQETDGMSFMAILKEIGSKTLQPTITANPSINGFGLSGAGAVEAGTPVATASYLAASLNPGSYKYGPKTGTGVVASNWKVERITDGGAEQVASVDATSLPAGSDNNGGNGFIIGDAGGANAVASLKYRVTRRTVLVCRPRTTSAARPTPLLRLRLGLRRRTPLRTRRSVTTSSAQPPRSRLWTARTSAA